MIFHINEISKGNRSALPPEGFYQEFRVWAQSFNQMLLQLDTYYQDIYQLLDLWISNELSRFVPGEDSEFTDWKLATKALMRDCREHSRIIYHIFNSISRDRLERYVFTLTDDAFFQVVRRIAGDQLAEETALEIAAFCRYAYIGFFMQFLWNRMQSDIDESVDRLGVLFDGFVESAVARSTKDADR